MNELARVVEALLFLSAEPVSVDHLADACECSEGRSSRLSPACASTMPRAFRGVVLRRSPGFTGATDPWPSERRELLARPRTLTQAEAECLGIVAYLQPVSRRSPSVAWRRSPR